MLEETEVLERYKFWLDSVAELFGGLDILALEVVVSKDGIEQIIGVNDSALSLLGNQQEEDRKHIFDLVMEKLEVILYNTFSKIIISDFHSHEFIIVVLDNSFKNLSRIINYIIFINYKDYLTHFNLLFFL